MIRDIEARGKRSDIGIWWFGFYYKTKGKHFILGWEKPNSDSQREQEVVPETVDEFIGLTDKNGVRIFNRDILLDVETGKIGLVHLGLWELMDGGFYCWCAGGMAIGCRKNEFIAYEHVVIGNIHDNPKLLEKKR